MGQGKVQGGRVRDDVIVDERLQPETSMSNCQSKAHAGTFQSHLLLVQLVNGMDKERQHVLLLAKGLRLC